MNKRIISVITAGVLMVSSMAAIPSEAIEVEQETSKTSGTFFFDATDWGTPEYINFFIWDDTTGEYATKNKGWITDSTWGSVKKLSGTPVEDKPGIYESYEFDLSGREDHAVYVNFHNRDTDAQTFQCLINESVFGCTAKRNGVTYERPVDSDTSYECVDWDGGSGLGTPKTITSSGKVQGEVIAPGTDTADTVAKFVLNYLGKKDTVSGDDIVTQESVSNAISAFGTDSDSVWEKYLTHSGEENYNESEAKKVIRQTDETLPNSDGKTHGKGTSVYGLFGNIDNDGKITSADSLKILRASVSLETLSISQFLLADVDDDQTITSSDALEVLRVSVGLPTNTKAGTYGTAMYNVYY